VDGISSRRHCRLAWYLYAVRTGPGTCNRAVSGGAPPDCLPNPAPIYAESFLKFPSSEIGEARAPYGCVIAITTVGVISYDCICVKTSVANHWIRRTRSICRSTTVKLTMASTTNGQVQGHLIPDPTIDLHWNEFRGGEIFVCWLTSRIRSHADPWNQPFTTSSRPMPTNFPIGNV
jgi:hypothetical protein